ncbi:unnamed protein product [Euphydryas editha]|uniref:Uncharacterized protein n=1 Tax=Euphydryas editha TaxID=104508 RepID=A0AAU9TZE5_EUPED|nr:unnamed protein product [Euphydryas editha]
MWGRLIIKNIEWLTRKETRERGDVSWRRRALRVRRVRRVRGAHARRTRRARVARPPPRAPTAAALGSPRRLTMLSTYQ